MAENGAARRRTRIVVAGGMLATIVLVAVLGFFLLRPAVVLGVDGNSLQCSVDCEAFTGAPSCRHLGGDEWSCLYSLSYGGAVATSRFEVDGFGCWHGAGPAAGRISGCIGFSTTERIQPTIGAR